MKKEIKHTTLCYHCGEDCADESIHLVEKYFCCDGCKLVYEIINKNDLCEYYDISAKPGLPQKIKVREGKFSFLDDKQLINKLVYFTDGKQQHVKFYLPQMHCSSCIWLLENLHKLEEGVIFSNVNFLRKEVRIGYDLKKSSLRKVAEILTAIGYEPHINLADLDDKKVKKYDKAKIFKLGIAGFCFGNIMMLSFPDYFSSSASTDMDLKRMFSYINLFLALPVFFYSSSEFYISAWKSLKQRFLNIDAPIVLAILITFTRSVYEILSNTGAGYLDSMSGIVFFMLIGRVFQDRTYQALSFERDYKSYFPIAVTVKKNDKEENVPVSKVKIGDRIVIRNNELIPADAILFFGKANIDYSFVTGESLPVEKTLGEIVYAGGKQMGAGIELEVVKEVSQSYLTQLWNNDAFSKQKKNISFVHKLSRQFTWILFTIAALTAIYWYYVDASKILNAVTAILIIACPCALLLSATFTNGNMLRIFGKNKFYIKDPTVIEALAEADTIVFDKTGTITANGNSVVEWEGVDLSVRQKSYVLSLAKQSNHPLSNAIADHFKEFEKLPLANFKDHIGKGVEAIIDGKLIKMGSLEFITNSETKGKNSTRVYLKIDEHLAGHFLIRNQYRNGLEHLVSQLSYRYNFSVLSGDNDGERKFLQKVFGLNSDLQFNVTPDGKLNYIKALQKNGHRVIMIGDGLNDAGALKKSDAGISITESANNFTPASDAIMDAAQFSKMDKILSYARTGKRVIIGSFIISIIYNIIGLSFAVQGTLSPVIAAILMPISSVSIVAFTAAVSSLMAKKNQLAV